MRLRSPLDREILRLAVPALGALVAEPLFLLTDTALVGHLGSVPLAGLGVASVSSSMIIIPVPQAGDNPFKSAPGASFTTALSGFAAWGVALALCVPATVLAVLALVVDPVLFGWLTLVVGVGLGAVFLVIGVRIGSATFDRRGPELLARLRSLRSA